MGERYEAYESNRGGYGYVDLRNEEGGSTVLGANGEGGFTLTQAEAVAGVLNEMLPAPGLVRIDVTEDQARLLSALLKSGLDKDVLYDQGVDIAPEEITSLVRRVKEAVEFASLDEGSSPSP